MAETKIKYKHQIVLKNSKLDIGLGPGVVFEKPLELSERTEKLLNANVSSIVFAKTDCDMMFLTKHVEVRMVKA